MCAKARTTTMNRAGTYGLEYAPFKLADDFPISVGSKLHRQHDLPITQLHMHDCLEIGYCYSGSGIFVVENKVFPFRADDLCVINDEEMHLAQSMKGTVSEWRFVMVDPARLLTRNVDNPAVLGVAPLAGRDFANIMRGLEHPRLRELVLAVISELLEAKEGCKDAVRGLMLAVMAGLQRLPGRRKEAVAGRRRDMEKIAPAFHHLAMHYAEPIRIPALARMCNMSATHFRRMFTKAVGRSPARHLTSLRVRMAAALLESTERKVLDIALEVGYPTLSSFNRHFKTVMGMSPRELRRRL
jgi:AraC-like DNA-binding protein